MRFEMRSIRTVKFVGGLLCLDFTNTVHSRRGPDKEYLGSYADFLEWCGRVGLLNEAQRSRLLQLAQREPRQADAALRKAVNIRELIYRQMTRAMRRSPPDEADSRRFMRLYGQAHAASQMVRTADAFGNRWALDASLEAPLWPMIHSAGGLLFSERIQRVKECDGCGWLFLDKSKNQSRRWCRMNDCGAQNKMRKYLKRKKRR